MTTRSSEVLESWSLLWETAPLRLTSILHSQRPSRPPGSWNLISSLWQADGAVFGLGKLSSASWTQFEIIRITEMSHDILYKSFVISCYFYISKRFRWFRAQQETLPLDTSATQPGPRCGFVGIGLHKELQNGSQAWNLDKGDKGSTSVPRWTLRHGSPGCIMMHHYLPIMLNISKHMKNA